MSKPLTKADRIEWRRFLNSDPGVKGLSFLEELSPAIYENDHAHNILLKAGEQNGHLLALKQLRALQNFEEPPQSDDESSPLDPIRTR